MDVSSSAMDARPRESGSISLVLGAERLWHNIHTMKPTTFVLDEAVANSDNLTANHNRPRIAAASLHGECFATEVVPVSATNVSRSNGSSEALGLRKAPQKVRMCRLGCV
ncbi:hypothetical protein V6N11_045010 [Hibiscus sabdariffa]|uniref:Uncharacterized protein n=2 Tax=Hibiscus sabdariffa TaxID=183260 RepID=A0ABR1ZTW1_9ROSI